jgi:D-arabinose 5-phosphate isomerase GutQ
MPLRPGGQPADRRAAPLRRVDGAVSETKHGPAGREDGGENARASLTLRAATDALRHESAMVVALADGLDLSFVRAVEMVRSCEGRVVVTGLGKSGLVGRKIAATLASTGTPAFFVHAAEAHNGDAGMVLPQELLLAISNSGETDEVVAFARLAHARGSVVIAFASSSRSLLGREADEFVDIGVQHEHEERLLLTELLVVLGIRAQPGEPCRRLVDPRSAGSGARPRWGHILFGGTGHASGGRPRPGTVPASARPSGALRPRSTA